MDGPTTHRYSLGRMIPEQAVTLATSDGAVLEARLALPPDPSGGAVVCHPHPLYGGDMDNPVVVRVAEVCADLGLAALRFNFRGVGASTGTHDQGRAEQRDVEAALDRMAATLSAPDPLLLAGYSFGATVAAQVAGRQERLAGLVLIAPPLALTGREPFLALRGADFPVLLIAGDRDEYCTPPALAALAAALAAPAVEMVPGANHFFFGTLFPFGERVRAWIAGRLEPGQAGRGGRAG